MPRNNGRRRSSAMIVWNTNGSLCEMRENETQRKVLHALRPKPDTRAAHAATEGGLGDEKQ